MHLKLCEDYPTHISHFHSYVSAYETNEETVNDLTESLKAAMEVAKNTRCSQVVDQDNMEHIFLVLPGGRISLYRRVGTYEVVKSD